MTEKNDFFKQKIKNQNEIGTDILSAAVFGPAQEGDSPPGWITEKATKLIEKDQLFESVMGERVDMGFCIMAQKAGDFKPGIFQMALKALHKKPDIIAWIWTSIPLVFWQSP